MTTRKSHYRNLVILTEYIRKSGTEIPFHKLFPKSNLFILGVDEFPARKAIIQKLLRLSDRNYKALFETQVKDVQELIDRLDKFLGR